MHVALATATATLALAAPAVAAEQSERVYGVVDQGGVETLAYVTTTSGNVTVVGPIGGLAAGERVISMDFRPATGQLYALTSDDELNLLGGIATTTPTATPLSTSGVPLVLSGDADIDFNPVPDAIRIVGDAGENFRLVLATGVLFKDTNLSGDATGAVGAAYSNAIAGAQQTTLYAVDSDAEELLIQGGLDGTPSPNAGATTSIAGFPGLTTTIDEGGFDISSNSGRAIALRSNAGARQLYDVSLKDASILPGVSASDATFHAIAIQPAVATISFTVAAQGVAEDSGAATLTVRRVGNINSTVNVNYAVAGAGASPTAADDLGTPSPAAPLAFAPGEATKTITVPITNDTAEEPSETFTVQLTVASGGNAGTPTLQTVTVFDDDPNAVNVPGPTTEVPGPTVRVPGPTVTVPVRVTGDQVLLIAAPSSLKRTALLRGLRLRTSCAEACRVTYTLKLGSRTLGTATGTLASSGIMSVTVRLTSAGRRVLNGAFRSRRVRSRKLTLTGTATDSDGGKPATQRVSVAATR